MRRIDDRTVELTEPEMACRDRFGELESRGLSLPLAAQMALNEMRMGLTFPSDEFIDYLSDGTCRRWGRRVQMKPEWRIATDEERKVRNRLDRERAKRQPTIVAVRSFCECGDSDCTCECIPLNVPCEHGSMGDGCGA